MQIEAIEVPQRFNFSNLPNLLDGDPSGFKAMAHSVESFAKLANHAKSRSELHLPDLGTPGNSIRG